MTRAHRVLGLLHPGLVLLGGLVLLRTPLQSDALSYYRASLRLIRGMALEHFWPPGWPGILAGSQALFGTGEATARIASLVLMTTAAVLQVLAVMRFRAERTAGHAAWMPLAVLLMNAPYMAYQAGCTFAVVPMTFLAAAWVLSLGARRRPWLSSLWIGLMALVRLGAVLLLLPAASWFRDRLRARRSATLFMLLGILPLCGGIVWVSVDLGTPVLLNTANGVNLYYGNHPDAPLYESWRWGSHRDAPRAAAIRETARRYGLESDADAWLGSDQATPSAELAKALQAEGIESILRRPDLFSVRVLSRASLLLAFDSSPIRLAAGRDRTMMLVLLAYMLLSSLIIKCVAVLGIACSAHPMRRVLWMSLLALAVPHLIAFAHPSYGRLFMTMVLPLIAVTGSGASWQRVRDRRFHVGVAVALILFCHAVYGVYMLTSRDLPG